MESNDNSPKQIQRYGEGPVTSRTGAKQTLGRSSFVCGNKKKRAHEGKSSAHRTERLATQRLDKIMAGNQVTDYEWNDLRQRCPKEVEFWKNLGLNRQEIFDKLNASYDD